MDKSDIALIISGLSALLALLSVIYSRKIALNDAQRMKRKPLVLEISSSPCKKYDGWHSVLATVRNFEPVAARLAKLRLRKRRNLKLLPQHASFGDGPEYNRGTVNVLPENAVERFIELGRSIEAQGHVSSLPGSGPVKYVWFYSNGHVTASDFILDWEWVDGTER